MISAHRPARSAEGPPPEDTQRARRNRKTTVSRAHASHGRFPTPSATADKGNYSKRHPREPARHVCPRGVCGAAGTSRRAREAVGTERRRVYTREHQWRTKNIALRATCETCQKEIQKRVGEEPKIVNRWSAQWKVKQKKPTKARHHSYRTFRGRTVRERKPMLVRHPPQTTSVI